MAIAASADRLSAEARVPFDTVLAPFVQAGRTELERHAGDAIDLFAPEARATLESALLQFLSFFALPVLDHELALREGIEGRFPWAAEPRSSEVYERFVDELAGGGLAAVLRNYPILEQTITSWTSNWARAHARLASRLQRDWPLLQDRFGIDDAVCRIAAITPYRSDPHNGGQAVAFVRLEGGRLLVYKPRALAMEEGFGHLLAWTNASGFPWPYRPVALLAGDDHGWMEYVAAAPCVSGAEVEAFYARAGGLLCLLTLLQATDIHHENLIASGSQPVLVDLETLFHPRLDPELGAALGPGSRRGARGDDFATSLCETGFLPSGGALDFSALGATGAVDTPFAVTDYSDRAASVRTLFRAPRRGNVPNLNGCPEIAAEHEESIIAGFREMFLLVVRHREELLAAGSVLHRFAGSPGRFIARSSNVYGLLLHQSLQPAYMRDGALRSELFEHLRRGASDRVAAILEAELLAIDRMDVPYLTTTCGEAGECWPSPLAQVLARIARAAESDLPEHLHLLRGELANLDQTPQWRPPLKAAAAG